MAFRYLVMDPAKSSVRRSPRRGAWGGGLARAALLLALSASPVVAAADPAASASVSSSPAADLPPDSALPALPQLPPIRLAEADPDAVKHLESLLARVTSEKADIRATARAELAKADATMVPAIHARIEEIRESLDRERAPRLIADARKAAHDAGKGKSKSKSKDKEKEKDKAKKGDVDGDDGDWLGFLLDQPQPKDETWREVTQLLAMVRMLGAIGTTPAVRELIDLRGKFGEMLRIDLSRQLAKLGDKAVPALLEATKHDAASVQRFAELELDRMGKVTPGEAVGSSDPEVLADTLRAFGYIREVEAVDVLLSFANHDRRKVREAARQAVTAIGEPGRWRLRDAYQDLTGEKVDKSVPWDTLAKRMFAIYDRARITDLVGLFDGGARASKEGKWADAVAAFDKVLATDPLFERRKEMQPAYFEVAKTIGFDKVDERLALLRKALRLDPTGAGAKPIEAEIAFSEAKALIAEGKPDRYLLARAVELDPTHQEAAQLLANFDQRALESAPPPPPAPRWALSGGILAAAIALSGLVAFFRMKKPAPPAPPAPPPPAPASPGPEV